MLPLALEMDSATVQLLFSDLLTDLKVVDRDQNLALSTPNKWIETFNKQLLSPNKQLVDVHRSQLTAQATQMYIEKLIVHPMKIILTFVQTPYPRKKDPKKTRDSLQTTAINVLTLLASVDRMQLKLKSFEVDDVLESRASLVDLISRKTLQDLQSQLAQIAGTPLFLLSTSVPSPPLRSPPPDATYHQ